MNPYVVIVVLLGLFAAGLWIVTAQTTGTDVTIPPGATAAEMNATFATIRTNCLTACGLNTFVNYGLRDTAGAVGTVQGSSYPTCLCRDRQGRLTEVVLQVTKP